MLCSPPHPTSPRRSSSRAFPAAPPRASPGSGFRPICLPLQVLPLPPSSPASSAPACVHWFLKFACSPAGAPVGQTGEGAAAHGTPEYRRRGSPRVRATAWEERRRPPAPGGAPERQREYLSTVPLIHDLASSMMIGAAGGAVRTSSSSTAASSIIHFRAAVNAATSIRKEHFTRVSPDTEGRAE
ncbi:hypothetical protein VPH35_069791 [Triticum aestivum]